MEPIKTQDVYLPVPHEPELSLKRVVEWDGNRHITLDFVEKKSDMVVMTKKEFDDIIKEKEGEAFQDGLDMGYAIRKQNATS